MVILSIEDFGAQLLKSQDLDPVYVALHGAALGEAQQLRLCLAYWCLYHLGAAAKLSELSNQRFWMGLADAAHNEGEPKPWPRGAERRHWRGSQAIVSAGALMERYKRPEDAALGLMGVDKWPGEGYGLPFSHVSAAAQSHRGFGQWIAFKIADMAERVFNLPVDFSDCTFGVYKDPRQGAAMARQWRVLHEHNAGQFAILKPWDQPITDSQVAEEFAYWTKHFRRFKAPPTGDRPVGVQEIETVMCKWKSHVKGSYPLLKDTNELRYALPGWGRTAEKLLEHLPTGERIGKA